MVSIIITTVTLSRVVPSIREAPHGSAPGASTPSHQRNVPAGAYVGHFLPHERVDAWRAMQDVFGSIVITVQFGSTVGARVPSHTEVFRHNASTPTTGLRGAMRSHFHDGATSLFRFVATHRDEGSPAGI